MTKYREKKLPTVLSLLSILIMIVGIFFIIPTSRFARNFISQSSAQSIPIKAVIVTMFSEEADPILAHFGPWHDYPVAGLRPEFHNLHCRSDNICVVTTGMGYANAASSIAFLENDNRFDFKNTYFIVSGIAGVNPHYGTIGSAAWSDYLIDVGIQWYIDPRDAPHWPSGFVGIDSHSPEGTGPLAYQTEVATLDHNLVNRAYQLTRNIPLADNNTAASWRAHFNYSPARDKPRVIRCDTASADTWWSGNRIATRVEQWTRLLTHGRGKYCMTAQEDNATYEALKRGQSAGLVTLSRFLVLRAGSDFDRPYPSQSDTENLLHYAEQGGKVAAINLVRTLEPLIDDISHNWNTWA